MAAKIDKTFSGKCYKCGGDRFQKDPPYCFDCGQGLQKEVATLQRLLQVYGRHDDDCLEPIGIECSCGWSVVEIALAEKMEYQKEKE